MSERKVFHEIRSAGKTFTDKEWYDYCRASREDSSVLIRTQIGKYLFNDCDVCLNPEGVSLVVDKKSYGYFATIEWCYCGNGLYSYGYNYAYGCGGGCCGCSYVDKEQSHRGRKTESAAKIASCDIIISGLKANGRNGDKKLSRLIAMVEDYMKQISRPKIVQLELFDL